MTPASGKAEGGAELLPCPFCGGDKAHFLQSPRDNEWIVICPSVGGCCVATGHSPSKEVVRDVWNRRAHLATPAANGPGEADGWLPIESAPKDGTYVLAYCGDDFQSVCYWSTSIWVNGGAWIYDECRSDTVQLEPTHWRPLPAPPGASESTPQPGMVTVPVEPKDEAEFLLTQKMAEKLPWRNMDTVPKSESQPFLVIRRGIVLQVSNFEGRIYPDALEGVLDWDDGITDATGWLPIAALRSGEKGTP